MKSEANETETIARGPPEAPVEVAAPQLRAIRRREHKALRAWGNKPGEMFEQVCADMRRQRDRATSSLGLRRADHVTAVLELLELTLDPDCHVTEIDVGPTKRGCLSKTQASPRREEDHGPVARINHVHELLDLIERDDRTLGVALDARAFDDAWVLEYELVFNCSCENRP